MWIRPTHGFKLHAAEQQPFKAGVTDDTSYVLRLLFQSKSVLQCHCKDVIFLTKKKREQDRSEGTILYKIKSLYSSGLFLKSPTWPISYLGQREDHLKDNQIYNSGINSGHLLVSKSIGIVTHTPHKQNNAFVFTVVWYLMPNGHTVENDFPSHKYR